MKLEEKNYDKKQQHTHTHTHTRTPRTHRINHLQLHVLKKKHVQRMDTNRLPKQALKYKPNGQRNIGRPRKRWRDQLHLEDQGTG